MVYPGHPFLLRLTDFLRGMCSQSLFIYLNLDTLTLQAASFGAYLNGLWFASHCLPEQLPASITFKELYPIISGKVSESSSFETTAA